MPIPSTIADLSTSAASNYPTGAETVGTSMDDYLRAIQSIQKQVVSKGANLASATTVTFGNDGQYFIITGTTTINAFSNAWDGRQCIVSFSGALQLTNSAGLVLPGGANITTAANDCAVFVNESTGVWRCVSYQRAASLNAGPFLDTNALIRGSADATKLLRFEVDGFTTATTRVLTPPNADATIAGTNLAQTFTSSQRGTITTDNDLSFDMNSTNNFTCTPSAGGTLTFTNITAGQSGYILLVNGANYAIAAAATTKIATADLTKISASGTYLISYYSNGTNVYCSASASLA